MSNVKTPVQLYRYLLRSIKVLPQNAQDYYKHFVRQAYNSHVDETDPERIQQIITKAIEDSKWVVNKARERAFNL